LLIGEYTPSQYDNGSITIDNVSSNPSLFTIKIGDIIYSYDANIAVTVISTYYDGVDGFFIDYNTMDTLSGVINIYSQQDDSTGCVLYVGSGGAVRVITEGGDDVILQGVPTGSFVPVQVTKIFLTDTAALNILALR
jgi:hypothetical protein